MGKNMDKNMDRNMDRKKQYLEGVRDGVPIGLGYFAVSFSLGIIAKNVGLTPIQAAVMSLLNNASAGEYMGLTVMAAGATYWEMALATLITNARYLLMSCAMSQRMDPDMPFYHRLLMAFDITDELFGITIARPGYLSPWYMYGGMTPAIPGWMIGTALGALAGSVLPLRVVSALSVALYGMFIAIFIPPARKDKVIAVLVALAFASSWALSALPVTAALSEGTRTIILTVALSTGAAALFPKKEEADQ